MVRPTPIFKKGHSTDVSNYRPISLTSLCCKVMESVIKDDILDHLLSSGLISRHQHGFLARRSTGTQLLDCFLIGLLYLTTADLLVHYRLLNSF